MKPDELTLNSHLTEAAIKFIGSCTVGIFRKKYDGTYTDTGSGTCVEINGRWLIATAGHVAEAKKKDLRLVPRDKRQSEFCRTTIKQNYWINEKGDDLGWIELEDSEKEKLNLAFISLRSRVKQTNHLQDDLCIIAGFPAADIKVNQNFMGYGGLAYAVPTVSPDKWPPGYDEQRDILLAYYPTGFSTKGGALMSLPEPSGLSGGGIWSLGKNSEGIWSLDSIRLIGIQIAKLLRADIVRGIQINKWLSFVGQCDSSFSSSTNEIMN